MREAGWVGGVEGADGVGRETTETYTHLVVLILCSIGHGVWTGLRICQCEGKSMRREVVIEY